MKKIELNKDRGNKGYYNYAIKTYGAEPIDEHRLKVDTEYFEGELFLVEHEKIRVLSFEYNVKKEYDLVFKPDEKYDYAMIFFCKDLTYNLENGKQLQLNIPTGFIILENSESLVFPRKKGDKIQRVTMYFNKSIVTDYMKEKLDNIKHFAYHRGDDHSTLWKKIYFDKGPKDIHDHFMTRWKTLKLEELTVIAQNILFTYDDSQSKKVYQDFEFEAVFEIRDYIQKHLEEKPVMKSLAKEYGINSAKLNEIFKHCFGHTIYQYYKHTRIHKVRDQIINTHKSLTEIAYEYGFSDINHLSKSFIEAFNEKPSDLKIASRKEI